MWPRNHDTIEAVPSKGKDRKGIYVLYDGSTPVYVGRGIIQRRVLSAKKSSRRGEMWDHFSWYSVPNAQHQQELEALLLRMLPPYLRILNRQRGKLKSAKKVKAPKNSQADPIKRSKLL